MARRYSGEGNQTPLANNTIIGLTSASTVRPRLYDILIGAAGTPEDKYSLFCVKRYTAAGTSTPFTPMALDPADPAALASIGSNHTVEPTYTANSQLLTLPLNARSTVRWVASDGGELVAPATAANGLGLSFIATDATIDHYATFHWME